MLMSISSVKRSKISDNIKEINTTNRPLFKQIPHDLKSPLPKDCETKVSIAPFKPMNGAMQKMFMVMFPNPTPAKRLAF